MELPRDQSEYWNGVAARKEFTHPWRAELLARRLPDRARVLDLGCGQGRILKALARRLQDHVIGLDSSRGMLAEARARGVETDLVQGHVTRLPFVDACFDLVVLFSVLTCLPHPVDQGNLFAEIRRVLRSGGYLLASDLLRQTDDRNLARYREGERRYAQPDVFDLPEGAVLTHPRRACLDALLRPFELELIDPLDVRTMNGHAAQGFQVLARKP